MKKKQLFKSYRFAALLLLGTWISEPLQAQTVTTIAGNYAAGAGYSGDGGPASAARLDAPWGLAFDSATNVLYIADCNNNIVRKVNLTTNVISTFVDASAGIHGATGIALDGIGNLYIADYHNNCIRKANISTGIVTVAAGTPGTPGYSGDGGQATSATINVPNGIAMDSARNLYIADEYNNVIRKVNTNTGIITTIAGSGVSGYSGDGGPATAATMSMANEISCDPAGNLYISDWYNYALRKVDCHTGIITTVAGNGSVGFSGDGGPATAASCNSPAGVAIRGNKIVFCDVDNACIREINSSGIINTIAGAGITGYSDGPALSARFTRPFRPIYDNVGNMYVSDQSNNVVRKISSSTTTMVKTVNTETRSLSVYPNPSFGNITVSYKFEGSSDDALLTIADVTGKCIFATSLHNRSGNASIALPAGTAPGLLSVNIIQNGTVISSQRLVLVNN